MTKPIFAIDPGNTQSAYAVCFPDTHTLGAFGKVKNHELRDILKDSLQWEYRYAIEMIASYGTPVGASVFETCLWIGRFTEIVERGGKASSLVYRKDVKMHLCNSTKAKDGNIRQAMIERCPATGGGKKPVIGIKSNPGPMYGASADMGGAFGVALTFSATFEHQNRAAA